MYYVVLVLYLSVFGSSLPIHVFTCIPSVFQPNTTTLSRPKSVQGRAFKYTSIQRKYSVNTNKYNTRAVFLLTPCSLLQFSCQFFIRGVPVSCGLASEGWGRLRRAPFLPFDLLSSCLLALLSNGQQLIPEVELLQLMVDAEHMDDTRVLILYLFVFVCIPAYLLCIGRHLSGFVLYNVLYCITLYLHCIEIEYTLVESTGILLSHARGIQFVLTCICVY